MVYSLPVEEIFTLINFGFLPTSVLWWRRFRSDVRVHGKIPRGSNYSNYRKSFRTGQPTPRVSVTGHTAPFPIAAKTDLPPAGGLLLISLEVTPRFTSISDVVGPLVWVRGRWHLLLGAGRFDKSMSNTSRSTSHHAASNQDLPLLLPWRPTKMSCRHRILCRCFFFFRFHSPPMGAFPKMGARILPRNVPTLSGARSMHFFPFWPSKLGLKGGGVWRRALENERRRWAHPLNNDLDESKKYVSCLPCFLYICDTHYATGYIVTFHLFLLAVLSICD